jgi:hypothetical protein
MNLPVLPFLRLLLIQAGMTLLIALPLHIAQAAEDTIILKEHINSYVYEGNSLNLVEELEITKEDHVVQINIKAQAIKHDATLELVVNGKSVKTAKLYDSMKSVKFKMKKNEKLLKLEVHSIGAFVRLAKAKVVANEPIPGGLSKIQEKLAQEPAPAPQG